MVIGWKEYLDLPELGLTRLKAKIDTGARTSSLHVSSSKVVAVHPDGSRDLEFTVARHRLHPEVATLVRARALREVLVTDSGGHRGLRPLIETELILGPVRKRIALTLSDRSEMLFPMILGRTALTGDFLVDTSRKYLLRRWHRRPPSRNAEPSRSGG